MAWNNKKGPRPKGKGKRGKRAKPSKAFVKKVQSIIHKDVETKQAFAKQFGEIQSYNSNINSAGDNNFLVPAIASGTGDNARIGDQIRAQKMVIKGHFISRFTGSAGTTYYQNCRIGVRLFIVQPKPLLGQGANTAFATTWQGGLLKTGGTTKGFTGLISDLYAPINTDLITCYYDKVFYVSNPTSTAVLGSAGNNMFIPQETCKFFSKTLKLRNKLLRYDANIDSGLYPTNFNPTLLLGYSYLDGSSGDSVTTQIGMSWTSQLDYEDA